LGIPHTPGLLHNTPTVATHDITHSTSVDEVTARIATRFARPETRATAGELLIGLLSVVERKNG
jgi:hypothetical protein